MGTGTGLNGRANLARSLGRGNPLGQGEDQQSIYGQKYGSHLSYNGNVVFKFLVGEVVP